MSPKWSQVAPEPEEDTPLLRDENQDENTPRTETPLPITQITILLLLQITEPITSLSIRPYYKSGTIVSSLLFGLSRSFPALVFSRCLHGMLNGNVGVMKSMMAELTDETNMARGSSLISVIWAMGNVIGFDISLLAIVFRLTSGSLGPSSVVCYLGHKIVGRMSFSHPFWGEYPYFLPCLATASYALLAFSLAAIFLKETVKRDPVMKTNPEGNSDLPRVGEEVVLDGPVKDTEKPIPLRALLTTRSVVVSVANYGMVGMLDITAGTLIPLVWSTSVEFGGLSMSPASIGSLMSVYGLMYGVFQFVAFPRIVRRFGPRRVLIAGIALFSPVYIMFPFENLASRHGLNLAAALLIVLQFFALTFSGMGFGAIFMYIASAAPNKRSLGATNGIAQTIVSIQRAVGPTVAAVTVCVLTGPQHFGRKLCVCRAARYCGRRAGSRRAASE
ncbi:MFS general substrate transporter [Lactarius indigo]|nr:MFS general substrate transporter [Lactarius indigo]